MTAAASAKSAWGLGADLQLGCIDESVSILVEHAKCLLQLDVEWRRLERLLLRVAPTHRSRDRARGEETATDGLRWSRSNTVL